MFRYLMLLLAYLVMFIVSMLAAPLLPMFALMRAGPADNANNSEVGPRLPSWLFWFDTATDNSLWGDAGWRKKHCPNGWGTWSGMVRWLWRNPAAGFCWSILARNITGVETYLVSNSGCGLNLDKGRGQQGWFLIRASNGAFQFRWVKIIIGMELSFESGWLLDIYIKDKQAVNRQPMAPFCFEPHLVKKKSVGV